MSTASIVVTIVLAVLFTFTSSIKLLKVDQSLQIRDHLGVAPTHWTVIGLLELGGVAGLIVGFGYRPIGVAAAIWLGLLAAGAIATHVRAKDGLGEMIPAVVAIVLAIAAVVLSAT